eukprot:g12470.t1
MCHPKTIIIYPCMAPAKVWEASTGQRLWHLDHGYVLQAFFLPGSEESEFLSVSDETVRIWSLQRADPITLEGHSAVILSIVCSKNGERICSGSLDKTVRVWDRQGSCLWVLHGHYDAVRAVAISERWLASSSGVAARVWSMESGSCDAIINDHAGSIISMQFSRDSGLLLVAFGCGREVFNNFTSSGVKVWCTSTKQCVAFHSTGSFILGAHLLDGPSILIATAERVELWHRDQWLDWALAGPVYRRVAGREPGSSWKLSSVEDEEDGDDEEAMGGRPAWRGTPSEPGRDLETVLVGFWDRPRDRREHAKEHRRFGLDVRVTEFPMISDVGGEQRSCLIRLIPEKLPVEEQLKCLRCGCPLRFLMQESCFHRMLHLFVCTSCQPNEARVFRAQLPRTCPYYSSEEPDREALAWRKMWITTEFTGKQVLQVRDEEEFLAIDSPDCMARYGSIPEILDDGRTIGLALGDTVAFGICPQKETLVAVNVWRVKRPRTQGKPKAAKDEEVRGPLRMLGGDHFDGQDLFELYGRDAEIAPEEVPSDLRSGDWISFLEPQTSSDALSATDIQVLSKPPAPVPMGDGEDGEGRKGRHFPRKQNVPAAEKLENCTLFMFDEVEKTVFLMSLTKPLTPGLGCEAIEALQRAGPGRLFGHLPALPPKWIRIVGKSTGKVFFYNMITGESTSSAPPTAEKS